MNPSPTEEITRLSPASFARFARFITSELGIKMPDSKLSMVQSRLLRRVRELGFDSVERYSEYFFQAPEAAEERIHLINAVTTNKTDFFREPAHFDYLTGVVLGQERAGTFLKVWSAGCSSGEEPYTLAMVLSAFATGRRGFDFSILATDVSTRVLALAQAAIYEEFQVEAVPPGLRARYLLRSRNREQKRVRIVPALRERVSFHQLNFMDAHYGVKDVFDVIFFRNVMIYFDRPTQEAVIRKLCEHLARGGYLFVGHSESLAGLEIPVVQVRPSIFCKR